MSKLMTVLEWTEYDGTDATLPDKPLEEFLVCHSRPGDIDQFRNFVLDPFGDDDPELFDDVFKNGDRWVYLSSITGEHIDAFMTEYDGTKITSPGCRKPVLLYIKDLDGDFHKDLDGDFHFEVATLQKKDRQGYRPWVLDCMHEMPSVGQAHLFIGNRWAYLPESLDEKEGMSGQADDHA
jgi:hypothetical protein